MALFLTEKIIALGNMFHFIYGDLYVKSEISFLGSKWKSLWKSYPPEKHASSQIPQYIPLL